MKNTIIKFTLFSSLTLLLLMFTPIEKTYANSYSSINSGDDLSFQEIEGLLLMREEEKLARDVYAELYKKWNVQIFDNISQSENRHTEAIKNLLDQYDLSDPYIEGMGKYTNPKLTELHNTLITKGSISLKEALLVGATIEDLDIADLDKLISETKNEDILMVYENLNRGSRNHIRSFMNQLDGMDFSYTPQYINQNRFDGILMGTQERGGFVQKGNKKGSGKGHKCGSKKSSCKGSKMGKGNNSGCGNKGSGNKRGKNNGFGNNSSF